MDAVSPAASFASICTMCNCRSSSCYQTSTVMRCAAVLFCQRWDSSGDVEHAAFVRSQLMWSAAVLVLIYQVACAYDGLCSIATIKVLSARLNNLVYMRWAETFVEQWYNPCNVLHLQERLMSMHCVFSAC